MRRENSKIERKILKLWWRELKKLREILKLWRREFKNEERKE